VTTLEQPAAGDQAPHHRPWWLLGGALAWAVVLVAAAVLSYHSDEPTVREQRSIAQAAPVVDRAAGELAAAADGADVVLEISNRRLTAGCRITSARDGARLERSLTIRTTDAAAPAVLDRIASRLPAGYRASVRHSDLGDVHRLRADAGEFVAITGAVTSPGVVGLTVKTGCRPPSPALRTGTEPRGTTVAPLVDGALALLGARATERLPDAAVPCPDGRRTAWTSRATGLGALGPGRSELVRGVVVIDTPTEIAVRFGSEGLRVQADGDRLSAVHTSGCPRR
jgi:hypothetical protein